jgi:DNA-directed RNA polymerase subunit N (RpoN/RPB10)
MTGDSLLYEISNENIITIEQLESYRSEYLSSLTENSTDEEILLQYDLILNKILGLFTTSKILDELGLTRYCCRMTVMSPTILPGGANMKVGSSIQTIGDQRLYNSSMSSIRSLANSTPTNRMSGLPSHNLSKMRPISTITTPPRSSRIRSIAKR